MRFVVGNFWSAPRVTTRGRFLSARPTHSGSPGSAADPGPITTPLRDYRGDRLDATFNDSANDPSATRKSA